MDKKRLEIINEVVSGEKSVQWACAKLKRSRRTVERLVKRLKEDPKDTLEHGNKGKVPVNKIDDGKIWNLYATKYYGYNITHFCEKLEEKENIKVSEGKVRLIFKEHHECSVQAWHRTRNETKKILRKMQKLDSQQSETLVRLECEPYVRENHPSQPRSKYFGEELQMDASEHLWFGGIKSFLHTAIDDAKGEIVGGWFDTRETKVGYYEVTRQFLTNHGIPVLIRTDKRTVFEYESKKKKDMADDTMTQYQHVCQTLGIELECSSIPQTKPRVERSYKTLQGRLPMDFKELGITTIEEANAYLPEYIEKFNKKFALQDENIESCWTKISQEEIYMALVTFTKRVVDSGNGIRLNKKYYGTFDKNGNQIFIKPKTSVSIITMMDGSVYAMHDDKLLALEEIPARQSKSEFLDPDWEKPAAKKKYIPPYDSIWRITNANLFRKKSLNF